MVRVGALIAPEAVIVFPSDKEIKVWMKSVSARSPVEALLFDLILRAGTNFTDGGLCNKGHGQANPHYCHPACENQLIFPDDAQVASKSVVQAIQTVEYTLGLLEQACADEDVMLVAQFRGQIKSLLGRWNEVDAHFAKNRCLKRLVPNVVLLK